MSAEWTPTRFAGVLKILRFNWPWYAVAGGMNLMVGLAWIMGLVPATWMALMVALAALGDFWLVTSLLVSHLVYDWSGLSKGSWLDFVGGGQLSKVAVLHAGQDEATVWVQHRFPTAEIKTLDFFDPRRQTESSLLRARTLSRDGDGLPADIRALPFPSSSLDLACLVFAAHELRAAEDRGALFQELRRTIKPAGRVVVVEHLRDGWNALAYGPGCFHFLPRRSWILAFEAGGMALLLEGHCTPFVRIFVLGIHQ